MNTVRQLRMICHAGKTDAPRWYRLNRDLSIYITWLLLHTRISPNQVSILMILTGLGGIMLITSTNLSLNLLGFNILYISFLLDKVDGEIARYRCQQSLAGMFLDRLYHRLVPPSIFLALAYREFSLTGQYHVFVLAFASTLLTMMIEENRFILAYIVVKYYNEQKKWPDRVAKSWQTTIRKIATWARPMKVFKSFVLLVFFLPMLLLLQQFTGFPLIKYFLSASSFFLALYYLIQCVATWGYMLDEEIGNFRRTFCDTGHEARSTIPGA